jgi:hypothetical protein
MFCKSLSLAARLPFSPFFMMVHLTASRVNDTTTKVVQPDTIFSSKSESNSHSERERPNSISVGERGKATMAFSFTDSPQNEYGIISGGLSFQPLCQSDSHSCSSVFFVATFSFQPPN